MHCCSMLQRDCPNRIRRNSDPDADGDGLIGVSDLLALLGVFQEEDMDNDGIWDSQDDCVGEYDACGVCNGEVILGPLQFACFFRRIRIRGNSDWQPMLDCRKSPNGTLRERRCYSRQLQRKRMGFHHKRRCGGLRRGPVASNTPIHACDPAWSLNEYGRLYNWYAVDDTRGLCPSGWHVPTDESGWLWSWNLG